MTGGGRIPLLVNPAAGDGRARAWAERLAFDPGLAISIAGDPGELVARVRREVSAGTERLLVAGGDGSIHAAIQELAGSACALGIVPIGRGNDLARALGLPLDPLAALARARSVAPRRIDLGAIGDRLFAGVAALGLDGEVARKARERGAARGGRWIYPYIVLRVLIGFRPPHFRLEHDGGVDEGPGWLAAVANSPCYGGGMRIAPMADLADGLLDLVFVRDVARLRLLALFPRVYRGSHVGHRAVVVRRTRRVAVRVDRPLDWFGDGEPLAAAGPLGTEVAVRAGALAVAA